MSKACTKTYLFMFARAHHIKGSIVAMSAEVLERAEVGVLLKHHPAHPAIEQGVVVIIWTRHGPACTTVPPKYTKGASDKPLQWSLLGTPRLKSSTTQHRGKSVHVGLEKGMRAPRHNTGGSLCVTALSER